MPSISVVIPCFNEEKYLGKLLQDLAGQTALPEEVIVADCQSEDKTLDIAEAFAENLPLNVVVSPKRTPGAARNAGADAAKGEYLLFIDADMRIPKNFTESVKSALSAKPVDFLTPRYKSDGQHYLDRLVVGFINIRLGFFMAFLHKADGIGGVVCVKKTAHQRIGGFNQDLVTQDDLDYTRRLRAQAASFIYLNKLTAVTSSRRFQKDGWRALFYLAFWPSKPKKYGDYK